ncbi:hypothetical protein LEMLEM_LOCUS25957 [Lemmus lemmus]
MDQPSLPGSWSLCQKLSTSPGNSTPPTIHNPRERWRGQWTQQTTTNQALH